MNRLWLNKIILILSTLSALIGIGFLFWILLTLSYKGISSIHWTTFTHDLVEGGIRNLLVGQFTMAILASLIAVPLGMMAGIYLREYGHGSKLVSVIRNLSDVMTSSPSIVIGVFVYALFVAPFGGYNGYAGSIALAIMMIPIIISTTDNMLALVPQELREAGMALGGSKHKIVLQIIVKAAKVGIMTGVLLAFARIIGETAPLLFTSANNQFFTMDLSGQFPSLTVSIYNLATYPDAPSRDLAWAASFILTMIVLCINLVGRFVVRNKK
ncbi:Phosphate transport system permease protein PstA (TC 3.A.1.7.1) [hydrothermal vent metagenome]|uniref:Phosphate transport system permease protein PstA (TC 3.A.1.7.1) n=1 Tax=hydrothermal vent metagenome TaxID=652676 RepID=A0A1W1BJ79_9ZZZZ